MNVGEGSQGRARRMIDGHESVVDEARFTDEKYHMELQYICAWFQSVPVCLRSRQATFNTWCFFHVKWWVHIGKTECSGSYMRKKNFSWIATAQTTYT